MKATLGYIMPEFSDEQSFTTADYFGGYTPGGYVEPAPEIVVRPVPGTEPVFIPASPVLQTTASETVSPLPVQSMPLVPTSAPQPIPDLSDIDLPTAVPVYQAGSEIPESGFKWWWLVLLAGGLYILSKKRGSK